MGSLRSTTRRYDDAFSKQRNLLCEIKALKKFVIPGGFLSHSQHDVKLSIITSFEQRESFLRREALLKVEIIAAVASLQPNFNSRL